jgi:soluble lytic murein transglycosylase-like protein
MKVKYTFLITTLLLSLFIITNYIGIEKNVQPDNSYLFGVGNDIQLPTSLKMYNLLEELSEVYDIPKHIVYNIAFSETRYKGPFDLRYNPFLTSSSGAEGPMQIMPKTANGINNKKIDVKTLRTDLRLNIETGLKLLRRLYDKYGDWYLVCGCYNTGRPIVNGYALYCTNNLNYKKNWINPITEKTNRL